jgi:(1->4)-alpha-D-glucan 1-alpha-D-glucosylmutase
MNPRRAAYRLQLHREFDFDAACGVLEYLRDLGISHVYCSPVLQAAPGSKHGYDVVDYHQVNEELGGEQGRERFLRKLQETGLGQLLDIVPNHMAITGSGNAWWWDTLENGTLSRYAPYFDIEWNAPEERLRNKILLPVLEDHSGRVVEAGKLKMERCGGGFVFDYEEHTFPVAPESMSEVLKDAAERANSRQLGFLADALARLPEAGADGGWTVLHARHRNKEAIRELLARLCSERAEIAEAIEASLERVNADSSRLDDLLMRQHYRLSRWLAAGRDLAYRRFFDVNSLVGIRVEDERVFQDTHELILRWLRAGELDGVRVDHADGLRDPAEYFRRLRSAAPDAWIVAEKILQPDERLPENWPIEGTTGYDFLNLANGLFVDPHGEAPLNELYREFAGEPVDFGTVMREKKSAVLRDILGSDVNRLTALLLQICEDHRDYRDYTRHELHETIRETIACFPVYRTYARAEAGEISEEDAHIITSAVEAASGLRDDLDERLFQFLSDILTLQIRGPAESEFVLRFQQVTSAAMAKGVEDTAFYAYPRLVSLNEVGGSPGRFGVPVEEFHKWCAETQARRPFTLLATSTHDTKRGEDVRSRIDILSEIPTEWAEAVTRWSAANARHRTGALPDRKIEYLLYQTLVGAWPISFERLRDYMRKAAREAKEHTSWIEPDVEYERALEKFIAALMDDREFIDDVETFLEPLAPEALANSCAQTLLKLTAPGVPDIYQGAELWELSLVDPDNRRPVDYGLRRKLLRELDGLSVERILARAEEGLPKLWIIRQALRVRKSKPECFGPEGTYQPLWAAGPKGGSVVAFQRGGDVIAIVPRLPVSAGNWEQVSLELPQGAWKNVLSGESLPDRKVDIAGLFSRFPVALLVRETTETVSSE